MCYCIFSTIFHGKVVFYIYSIKFLSLFNTVYINFVKFSYYSFLVCDTNQTI